MKQYIASCHCGAVKAQVELPDEIAVQQCNCSICQRLGFLHIIVPAQRFKLLTEPDAITTYTFNTGVAQHTFCKHCGVKAFYVPRSNPNGFSVNLRCLETTPAEISIEPFDGQNWEQHANELLHLT